MLSSYKIAKPALKLLQQKIRELGHNVLGAEAAARAKAAIHIKDLQDTIQTMESEVSALGQQLDEQEERFEKQRDALMVCPDMLLCSRQQDRSSCGPCQGLNNVDDRVLIFCRNSSKQS